MISYDILLYYFILHDYFYKPLYCFCPSLDFIYLMCGALNVLNVTFELGFFSLEFGVIVAFFDQNVVFAG